MNVSRKLLRPVLKKATMVQVDASIYMKIESYDIQASDGLPMLLLAPISNAQAAFVAHQGFSAAVILTGEIKGDELITRSGTRLRFFKLSPINLE